MIRTLIKLGFFLVVGILVYNLAFGTSEEKEQSKEVFRKTGSALSSAWGMLKNEKEKFNEGKYDKVLDQLGGAYRTIRDRAQYVDEKVLRRLDDLEKRKATLEKEIEGIENTPDPVPQTTTSTKKGLKAPSQPSPAETEKNKKKEDLMRELDRLIQDTDQLLKEAEQ